MTIKLIREAFKELEPLSVRGLKRAPDRKYQEKTQGENLKRILEKKANLKDRVEKAGYIEEKLPSHVPNLFIFHKSENGKNYDAGFHGSSIVNGINYDKETSPLIREVAIVQDERGTRHWIGFHNYLGDLGEDAEWEKLKLPKGYTIKPWVHSVVSKQTGEPQLTIHDADPRYPWVRNKAKMIFHGNKLVATVEPHKVLVYSEAHLDTILDKVVKPMLAHAKSEMN